MESVIRAAVERGASDIHIKGGDFIRARISGKLTPLTKQKLPPDQARAFTLKVLPNDRVREQIDSLQDFDCSWGIDGLTRFRVNVMRQRGSFNVILRVIPYNAPTLEGLGLPAVLSKIALAERGMILVTGVTGSGKSSTMAAMVQEMNQKSYRHIVTLEDPIEFLHRDLKSMVSQREVGADTLSFHDALRHVLRQDPDVIMLGEIRDRPSMETVLKAADTGHMVMSTLHTTDAAQTINRIISFFPPHQHAEIRAVVANALKAIVSLRLIPRHDRPGRVPAAEVLVNSATISELIRGGEALHTIPDHIAEGRVSYGMQTFDQSLLELYRKGWISYEWAMHYASNPSEFALRVSGVSPGEQEMWSGTPESPK